MRTFLKLIVVVTVLAPTALIVGPPNASANTYDGHSRALDCEDVVFIGVRGSGEDPGHGLTVWRSYEGLERGLRETGISIENRWLEYPAWGATSGIAGDLLNGTTNFQESYSLGVIRLHRYLRETSENCPASWIVVSGYSQGALVVRQALAASQADVRSRVGGVLVFGDPARVRGSDGLEDRGTAGPGLPGIYSVVGTVGAVAGTNGLALSWCEQGDFVCEIPDDIRDLGSVGVAHSSYQLGAANGGGREVAAALVELASEPESRPDTPSAPTCSVAPDGQATVSWTEPALNGTMLTHYNIRRWEVGAASPTGWSEVVATPSHTYPTLALGVAHRFQIQAMTAGLSSHPSDWSEPCTPQVALTPGGAGVTEGDGGRITVQVPISLAGPIDEDVTVSFETLDPGGAGLATEGVDFEARSGTLTIPAGDTTGYVTLTVLGDTVKEEPLLWGEWAFVRFYNASPNTDLDLSFWGLGIGVIIDDD